VGEKKNICGAEEILEISIHDLRDQIINPWSVVTPPTGYIQHTHTCTTPQGISHGTCIKI
jgi:hypothetical protein